MGAASSSSTGQVTIVELPNFTVGHPFRRLAFIPLTPRYFTTPASLSALHALYCSDRVRAHFRSGSPRLALEDYYNETVIGHRIAQCRAERGLPPTMVPLCIYGEVMNSSGVVEWVIVGYLSTTVWGPNYDADVALLEMFKVYSGARLSADSDVALTIMRAAATLYSAATSHITPTPWPSVVCLEFNKDDSGVPGALCRLFRYVALHMPAAGCIDFVVSEGVSDAGIPQIRLRQDEEHGLTTMLQTLSNDQSVRAYYRPSLTRDVDGRALAAVVGFAGSLDADEPMMVIAIRSLTNDSNFPSPANRDSQLVMAAATRLKTLHDECKSRARAPRITDVHSPADKRVAEILHDVLQLPPVSDDEVRDLADVIELQILMAMPDAQMHAPVVVKHSLAIQMVHRFIDAPAFADLIAGDVPKPQSPVNAQTASNGAAASWSAADEVLSAATASGGRSTVSKRDVVRETCRKCPWRVAATLLVHRRATDPSCVTALYDAVTAVLHAPERFNRIDVGERRRLSPVDLVARLIDLKLRGLVTMPFARASGLLFALTDVDESTPGLSAAREAFGIIDEALANAKPAAYE